MKPIRRTFDTAEVHYIPVDWYADTSVSINIVAGAATVETTISQINAVPEIPINSFDAVTLPGKINYPITGFILNVSAVPCVVEVAQSGT